MPLPEALPRVMARSPRPEVAQSPSLSLTARPGNVGIATRSIAVLIDDGFDDAVLAVHAALLESGAVPGLSAPKLGTYVSTRGTAAAADISLEAAPAWSSTRWCCPLVQPQRGWRVTGWSWRSSRKPTATARRFWRWVKRRTFLPAPACPRRCPTAPMTPASFAARRRYTRGLPLRRRGGRTPRLCA